jgi:hypothetical protein
MKRLIREYESQYLIKKFSSHITTKIHKFAEAKIGEDYLTIEIHEVPFCFSVYVRLRTKDGKIFTRSVRKKLNSQEVFDHNEFDTIWSEQNFWKGCLVKVVESRIDSGKFVDFKIDREETKVLRTFDSERLSASSFPVVNVDAGSEKKVIAKTENFLEVFKGLYSNDSVSTESNSYGYRRGNITPDVVFFGSSLFSQMRESLINSRSTFPNGATGAERNICVRENKDINTAIIERFNGESLTLRINTTDNYLQFYGLTNDHGKISIGFSMNGEHVPDANFSKIPVATDILNYFDIGFELDWLNQAKETNTVVPEICGNQVVYSLIKALLEKEK